MGDIEAASNKTRSKARFTLLQKPLRPAALSRMLAEALELKASGKTMLDTFSDYFRPVRSLPRTEPRLAIARARPLSVLPFARRLGMRR